jgi:5-formyltetrahydrofolate cyclo-ligase
MTKIELRKIALTKRNNLPQDQIQICSKDICNKIINSQEFRNAKVIHIYKSFGSEVQTEEIIQRAFSESKIVVIPEVRHASKLTHWQVFSDTIYSKDNFGINTPKSNCLCFDVAKINPNDLVIFPIVAFDSNNNRIGYGKGYYDKFLLNLDCKKIGVAFGCQLVGDFEPDSWDVRLDQIIHN